MAQRASTALRAQRIPSMSTGNVEHTADCNGARNLRWTQLQSRMKPRCIAALACVLMCIGCAPIPRHVYVANQAHGSPVYERCSLNPGIPAGMKVTMPGLAATVSVIQLDDRHGIVEVQFDVPAGRTLMLRDDVAIIDSRNSQPPVRASIANVNPVAPARYAETPAIQKLLLPANAPLPGGRLHLGAYSSDRHYWVAARFNTRLPDGVWVTLPAFTLDGVAASFPELHFHRRFVVGMTAFNC